MLQVDPFLRLAVREYNSGSGLTMAVTICLVHLEQNDCIVKSVTLGVSVCLLLSFVVFFVVNEAFESRKEALAQAITVI